MRKSWMRFLPWLLTIVIFAILFARIPLPKVLAALQRVQVLPYLALMLPYSVLYCLIDSFVLTRAIQWFQRRVPYRRIIPVRASSYILSILNPGLGQGAAAFYIHRREHLPFWAVAGTILFIGIMEICQLALYAGIGIAGFHTHLALAFAPIYLVLGAALTLGLLVLHRGVAPVQRALTWLGRRLRRDPTYVARIDFQQVPLVRPLTMARPRHYLLTILYKLPLFLCAIMLHHLALRLFGVYVPLIDLFTFLPIVFLVASLPVTVAHLGTSQAAWLYFFAAYGSEATILAYSLVAHVTFMVLNALLGLACLPLALRGMDDATSGSDVPAAHPPIPEPETPEM
jgi:hypothetical protein